MLGEESWSSLRFLCFLLLLLSSESKILESKYRVSNSCSGLLTPAGKWYISILFDIDLIISLISNMETMQIQLKNLCGSTFRKQIQFLWVMNLQQQNFPRGGNNNPPTRTVAVVVLCGWFCLIWSLFIEWSHHKKSRS